MKLKQLIITVLFLIPVVWYCCDWRDIAAEEIKSKEIEYTTALSGNSQSFIQKPSSQFKISLDLKTGKTKVRKMGEEPKNGITHDSAENIKLDNNINNPKYLVRESEKSGGAGDILPGEGKAGWKRGVTAPLSSEKTGHVREVLPGKGKAGWSATAAPLSSEKSGRAGDVLPGEGKAGWKRGKAPKESVKHIDESKTIIGFHKEPKVSKALPTASYYGVYGDIGSWTGGSDSDGDGYYETFSFYVGIDADADPGPTSVYGKIICETTGQEWWSEDPWVVQGYDYDYMWFAFNESDFAGYLSGNTTLDFTVEIYDITKTTRLAQDTGVSGESNLRVDYISESQHHEVYGAIDYWSGGSDSDGDGYYETFSFYVGIDADANPAAASVYGKIICETTGQEWWSVDPWVVQGYDYDYMWFAFDESDFAGYLSGNTTLDFTVEIYDITKTTRLAQDTGVSGESDLRVDYISESQHHEVYGAIDYWSGGSDLDADGYYETFSFYVGIDADANPAAATVYGKIICETTGQVWWSVDPWVVQGYDYDYMWFAFDESDFAGYLSGNTTLDFTVEIYDITKTTLLAQDTGVSGESMLRVEGDSGQYYGVYGAVRNWTPGNDNDGDGYPETYTFEIGIDADAYPDPTMVYGKIICETTGQAWWSANPWEVQGDAIDYHWFLFSQDYFDFGGIPPEGAVTLNFTVKIYDVSKSINLATDASVTGEGDLLVDVVDGIQNSYHVYGTVRDWLPGTDADHDNFYETFSFRIIVDGDAIPGPAEVTAKVRCETTGQEWWFQESWQVEGSAVDYHYLNFDESDFQTNIPGETELDFTVELWDSQKQSLLASDQGISGEENILVEPQEGDNPMLSLSPQTIQFVNEPDTLSAYATSKSSAEMTITDSTNPDDNGARKSSVVSPIREDIYFDETAIGFHLNPDGYLLSLENCILPEDIPGHPWLPARYINIVVPADAKSVEIETSAEEKLIRREIIIAPVQPSQPKSKPKRSRVSKNVEAYESDFIYPAVHAKIVGRQSVRGFNIITVRVNPLRYRPKSQELYFSERISVVIHWSESTVEKINRLRHRNGRSDYIKSLVINPEIIEQCAPLAVPAPLAEQVDYLIITNAALNEAFSELAEHRQAVNGLRTEVLDVETIDSMYEGNDIQEKIRNCIIDYYNNAGLTYVVIGGDDTVVPDRDCSVSVGADDEPNMPTDLYYSGLDGDWDIDNDGVYGEALAQGDEADMGPEIFVGRIPVRTVSQAQSYIGKLILYENTGGGATEPTFFIGGTKAWDLYSGSDRPTDAVDDGHPAFTAANHPVVSDSEMWARRLYRDGIAPYSAIDRLSYFFDTLTTWDGSTCGDYPHTSSNMLTKLNQGWENMFFTGHGNVQLWGLEYGIFSSNDASQLSSINTFVYTDACLTGAFDKVDDPSLSEAFLRNGIGGALAYMGCSRYGWGYTDPPPASSTSTGGPSTEYAYEFYERWLSGESESLGSVFAAHKAAMAGMAGEDGAYRWVQFGLNLQGDPAIGLPAAEEDQNASVMVSNIGDATLTVSSIGISVDWLGVSATTPFNVAPGSSEQVIFSIDWATVPKGTSTATVIFYSNDANSPGVLTVIAVNGEAEYPEILLEYENNFLPNGTNLDLGTILTALPETFDINVKNTGGALLTVADGIISGVDSDLFTINSMPTSIEPGESGTLQIEFNTPTSETGTASCDLEVVSDDPNNSTYIIHVTISWDNEVTFVQESPGYSSHGEAFITCEFNYPKDSDLLSLSVSVEIPAGWSLVAAAGDGAPEVSGNNILFTGALDNNPIKFNYELTAPEGTEGAHLIHTNAEYWLNGMIDPEHILAEPDPLTINLMTAYHTADYQEPWWHIDASEAGRVLAYWRADAYHVDPSTIDGCAPGPGSTSGSRHDADYQTPEWHIDGTEVNRVLAYWRAEAYHPDIEGPDGYAPGSVSAAQIEILPLSVFTVSHDVPSMAQAGEPFEVRCEVHYTGSLLSLLYRPLLPDGWSIVSAEVEKGSCEFISGEIIMMGEIPSSPVIMKYEVTSLPDSDGVYEVATAVEYMALGMPQIETVHAEPDPATIEIVETLPVGLGDAITILQVLCGMSPSGDPMRGDLNMNGKADLADVIQILQTIAGLR